LIFDVKGMKLISFVFNLATLKNLCYYMDGKLVVVC